MKYLLNLKGIYGYPIDSFLCDTYGQAEQARDYFCSDNPKLNIAEEFLQWKTNNAFLDKKDDLHFEIESITEENYEYLLECGYDFEHINERILWTSPL